MGTVVPPEQMRLYLQWRDKQSQYPPGSSIEDVEAGEIAKRNFGQQQANLPMLPGQSQAPAVHAPGQLPQVGMAPPMSIPSMPQGLLADPGPKDSFSYGAAPQAQKQAAPQGHYGLLAQELANRSRPQ